MLNSRRERGEPDVCTGPALRTLDYGPEAGHTLDTYWAQLYFNFKQKMTGFSFLLKLYFIELNVCRFRVFLTGCTDPAVLVTIPILAV